MPLSSNLRDLASKAAWELLRQRGSPEASLLDAPPISETGAELGSGLGAASHAGTDLLGEAACNMALLDAKNRRLKAHAAEHEAWIAAEMRRLGNEAAHWEAVTNRTTERTSALEARIEVLRRYVEAAEDAAKKEKQALDALRHGIKAALGSGAADCGRLIADDRREGEGAP